MEIKNQSVIKVAFAVLMLLAALGMGHLYHSGGDKRAYKRQIKNMRLVAENQRLKILIEEQRRKLNSLNIQKRTGIQIDQIKPPEDPNQ